MPLVHLQQLQYLLLTSTNEHTFNISNSALAFNEETCDHIAATAEEVMHNK